MSRAAAFTAARERMMPRRLHEDDGKGDEGQDAFPTHQSIT